MNDDNENLSSDMWDWQSRDYSLEDTTPIEISKCLLNGANKNDNHHLYIFDDETTPLKACGDLAYTAPRGATEVTGEEIEEFMEPPSQVKRRRMLQFEPEILDASLFHDDAFLRSQETQESVEDAISEISQWAAEFEEEEPGMSNECLDPASEGWIANCFSDVDLHFNNEDISSSSGVSDMQHDIPELSNTNEYDANVVKKQPVKTRRNVIFKGRKSYMSTPPKTASSVVKPFAFIKPFGADGGLTLKDINKRIHNPPEPIQVEDSSAYPTSAFSGKPVVGKTKIHTEGGKGSITILRTKG